MDKHKFLKELVDFGIVSMKMIATGLVGGLSFYLLTKNLGVFLGVILILDLILLMISWYLKSKFTHKCPSCGRFYKKSTKSL